MGPSVSQRCVFIESLAPSFTKSAREPQRESTKRALRVSSSAILEDRPTWLTGMLENFLNLDDYRGNSVSEDTVRSTVERRRRRVAMGRPGRAATAGLRTSRDDIKRIDIPTLILHGTADRILLDRRTRPAPARGSARRPTTSRSTADRTSCASTHADEVNRGAARVHRAARKKRRLTVSTPPPAPRDPAGPKPLPKEPHHVRSVPHRARAVRPGDRRRNITTPVPLRTRAGGRAEGARRSAGRPDREAARSRRSGSPSQLRSATRACASSSPSTAPGRCQ